MDEIGGIVLGFSSINALHFCSEAEQPDKDEEGKQSIVDEEKDGKSKVRRPSQEYLKSLAKEPYAVAVLGLVALTKGTEAAISVRNQCRGKSNSP